MVLVDIIVKAVEKPNLLKRIFGSKETHLCDVCNEEHPDQEVTAKFVPRLSPYSQPSIQKYYLHASCADQKIENPSSHQKSAMVYFNAYQKSPDKPLRGMPHPLLGPFNPDEIKTS